MFTIEQKVDLVLRYIASADDTQRSELKSRILEALDDGATTPVCDNPNIDDMILDLMKELGVPAHLLGHDYLVYAIKLQISDHTYSKTMTTRLYPDIAVKFDTTGSRAERAIRHAVEVGFNRSDWETIVNVFGSSTSLDRGKATNSEFIAACANEISRRMKNL